MRGFRNLERRGFGSGPVVAGIPAPHISRVPTIEDPNDRRDDDEG